MSYETSTAPRAISSLKKSGKPVLALLVAAAGVLLLLFGGRIGKAFSKDTTDTTPSAVNQPGTAFEVSIDTYRAALEAHITDACRQVRGVGDVTVVVSLGGGFEYVYAVDTKASAAGTSITYVTVGSGSNQKLVFLTERAPPITGIGVICTGGNDPSVRQEVTSLLSATYGIGTNKIYVTGKGP